MKTIIFKAIVLATLLLASGSMALANCQKECGLYLLLATFTRNCDFEDQCWVTECTGLMFDCDYFDPHNDYCDHPWFGCLQN